MEHGKTFGDNPYMYEPVIFTSMTGVQTPQSLLSEEHKALWKEKPSDELIKSHFEKVNYVRIH